MRSSKKTLSRSLTLSLSFSPSPSPRLPQVHDHHASSSSSSTSTSSWRFHNVSPIRKIAQRCCTRARAATRERNKFKYHPFDMLTRIVAAQRAIFFDSDSSRHSSPSFFPPLLSLPTLPASLVPRRLYIISSFLRSSLFLPLCLPACLQVSLSLPPSHSAFHPPISIAPLSSPAWNPRV